MRRPGQFPGRRVRPGGPVPAVRLFGHRDQQRDQQSRLTKMDEPNP